LLSRLNPPFRAEHIGSLLRPKALLDQRDRFARGEIDREALAAAEDAAIKQALALQERCGLKLATDGEFRRRSYHSFFYRQLGDLSIDMIGGEQAKGGTETGMTGERGSQPIALINSRVQWKRPINVPDFSFVAANTTLTPKITIPGPCALHFRGGDAAVLASAYKTSTSSGTTSSRRSAASLTRSPRPAAVTCRSTRLPSPSSAIRKCRRH